jgi:hypothetical protein
MKMMFDNTSRVHTMTVTMLQVPMPDYSKIRCERILRDIGRINFMSKCFAVRYSGIRDIF